MRAGQDSDGMCEDRPVTAQPEAATASPPDLPLEGSLGESRWPPALALLAFMAINIALRVWLPNEGAIRVPWAVPAVEAVLLILLLLGPAATARERRWLRPVAVAFVVVLVLAALWATAVLIRDLIDGSGVTQSPSELLASGAVVWLGNNIAFAMLYWLMDGGGPVMRARRPEPVDLAFTQHMSPELAAPGWRPVFLDYLHLGFTNATAFSPTDVMPLSLRAKYAMLVQASVALALFGLIVARSVNAFT
jgi:hypothetical protein